MRERERDSRRDKEREGLRRVEREGQLLLVGSASEVYKLQYLCKFITNNY